MIDTHCHLTFPDFAGDVDGVLQEAAELGVTGMITISTTTEDCMAALTVAEAHDRVWCSSGVHPLYSDKGPHDWGRLRVVAQHECCVAWGELGLDNHYPEPLHDVQLGVLEEQLGFIEDCHADGLDRADGRATLPIVVHCREAFDDLIPILRNTGLDPTKFVFHCFTGGPDDARKILDFGAHISFTGVVTYKNAEEVREAARLVPSDRMMVETDAPFLSPVPYRGKRPCRPGWVRYTAECLAELRNEPFETLCDNVDRVTEAFFGIRP